MLRKRHEIIEVIVATRSPPLTLTQSTARLLSKKSETPQQQQLRNANANAFRANVWTNDASRWGLKKQVSRRADHQLNADRQWSRGARFCWTQRIVFIFIFYLASWAIDGAFSWRRCIVELMVGSVRKWPTRRRHKLLLYVCTDCMCVYKQTTVFDLMQTFIWIYKYLC